MTFIKPEERCHCLAGACGCGSFNKYAVDLLGNKDDWYKKYKNIPKDFETHCICRQRIKYLYTIRHKSKDLWAIVGGHCFEKQFGIKIKPFLETEGLLIDILKKNDKLDYKTYYVNKARKLCKKLYDKNLIKNKKNYYPILQYVCGEIKTKKRMKLRIQLNIWRSQYGSHIIRNNKITDKFDLSGKRLYYCLKNKSNIFCYLKKINKIPDNILNAYDDYINNELYYEAGCYIYETKENKKYKFRDILKWRKDILENIIKKNELFKYYYEYKMN